MEIPQIISILNSRLQHHALHNEIGKDIRIDEVKILRGIIKDYAHVKA